MNIPINNLNDWHLLLQAAEQGDTNAQLRLALYYDHGLVIDGVDVMQPDEKLAYEWTKRAYENGNLYASEFYAYHLSAGLYCTKDIRIAIKIYEDAMKAGCSFNKATHKLGIAFRAQQDFRKAFSLYKKVGTAFADGMQYYYGIGAPKNRLKAFHCFKNVATNNSEFSGYEISETNYMIGKMYLEGEGVGRSVNDARYYLSLADGDEGHLSARHILWVIGRQ